MVNVPMGQESMSNGCSFVLENRRKVLKPGGLTFPGINKEALAARSKEVGVRAFLTSIQVARQRNRCVTL